MLAEIKQSVEFIKQQTALEPEIGIILGTGLGGLVNQIEIETKIPYENIPNFPVSTVEGHHGNLIFGTFAGKKIVAMQGRFHYYEGYSMQEVTFPVRVMEFLNIKYLIVSNASGGVNSQFKVGDLMIINDHINLLPNPLLGKNYKEFGPRFPDMSEAYDRSLIKKAMKIAKEHDIRIHEGVYCGVTGPTFETPAEYRHFRIIGADAVGMSTVPEVIVARHMDIPVFAMSVITDLGIEGMVEKVSHEEVQKAAAESEPKMSLILAELLNQL